MPFVGYDGLEVGRHRVKVVDVKQGKPTKTGKPRWNINVRDAEGTMMTAFAMMGLYRQLLEATGHWQGPGDYPDDTAVGSTVYADVEMDTWRDDGHQPEIVRFHKAGETQAPVEPQQQPLGLEDDQIPF